jgi:crossover junction endodeoxyribonuclease RuvC
MSVPVANIIGIDPGLIGAIALVGGDEALIDVADIPVLRDGSGGRAAVNAPLLAELLARRHAGEVACEIVAARAGRGCRSVLVRPMSRGHRRRTWHREASQSLPQASGLETHDRIPAGRNGKDAAHSEAIRRWPHKASFFAGVKDDGRAEAARIALAAIMREAGR